MCVCSSNVGMDSQCTVWSAVLQTVLNRLTQHICSAPEREGGEGGQAVKMMRRDGEEMEKMERIACVRERVRKWESTNDLMVCSIFSLFCGAQRILVLLLVSPSFL